MLKLDLAVTKEPVEETAGLQLTMSVVRFLIKIEENAPNPESYMLLL